MKIGTVVDYSAPDEDYVVKVNRDEILGHALRRGDAWRQVVYAAARQHAAVRYPQVVALSVMETLVGALINVCKVTVTSPMQRDFDKYQKLKALALAPGTTAEGRNAVGQAVRLLSNVIIGALD